jgi:hypothetical protein
MFHTHIIKKNTGTLIDASGVAVLELNVTKYTSVSSYKNAGESRDEILRKWLLD